MLDNSAEHSRQAATGLTRGLDAPATLTILSTRELDSAVYMAAGWSAERALGTLTGARVLHVNYARRQYVWQTNRLARWLRRLIPSFGQDLFWDAGSRVAIFAMGLHKPLHSLLRDPLRTKWLYLFDLWEPQWSNAEREFLEWRGIARLYLSSSQAAEYFASRLPFPVRWLPQAGDASEFPDQVVRPVAQRSKTVMNIGRTNTVLDRFFIEFCAKHGFQYLRELKAGKVVFADRHDFLAGLLNSQIVVVHPKNLEYPEHTGVSSFLTARYYEAYLSGAVVCGFKPTSGEFEKVLGSLAFIEYRDTATFERELLMAVNQQDARNESRQRVLAEHTWQARLTTILGDFREQS
jgi:hypothetical protein